MLLYPILNDLTISRDFINAFGGYNHNLSIADNEHYNEQNITSKYFPVLANRQKRGTFINSQEQGKVPLALIHKDALCYVWLNSSASDKHLMFNMNGSDYDLGATDIDASVNRSLVSMGAYVVILPDKKYINTISTDERGNIESHYETIENPQEPGTYNEVEFRICKKDGSSWNIDYTGSDEPTENLTNGYVWLDTSQSPPSLKQYSEISSMWSSVTSTYIKITAPGIDSKFNVGDGVTFEGVTISGSANSLNQTYVIQSSGENFVVIIGLLDQLYYTQTEQIIAERKMPEMDFIIESNNRLWGCRYGMALNGEFVNEIFASALGDFKNWNVFEGVNTDSYYASVGSDGQFTGAITYLGYPTFFKEDCCHVVYGSLPQEYQIKTTQLRGVQKGSQKSLAMVNEVLYYKSRTGVCAYNGSLPTEISSAFGSEAFTNAVGCGHKNNYYICQKSTIDNKYYLFVFDTANNIWHKEDETNAIELCPHNEEIYILTDNHNVITEFGSGTQDTDSVAWSFETGNIGYSLADQKYCAKLQLRLSLEVGSTFNVYIKYDSEGSWQLVKNIVGTKATVQSFTQPIIPHRCDHFSIRCEGIGEFRLYSIAKSIEQGSDIIL